jgi:hypothetical protein
MEENLNEAMKRRAVPIGIAIVSMGVIGVCQALQALSIGFVRSANEWYAGGGQWVEWKLEDGTPGLVKLDCFPTQVKHYWGVFLPTAAYEGPYACYFDVRLQSTSVRALRATKAIARHADGSERSFQLNSMLNRSKPEVEADVAGVAPDGFRTSAELFTYEPVELRPSDRVEVIVECDVEFEGGGRTSGTARFALTYSPSGEVEFVIPVE